MDKEELTYGQLRDQVERLRTQLDRMFLALQAESKEAFERGLDLEDINAILEEEICYRRATEESNEMLNDQWFSLLMENQHLRTALEQARQENDHVNDKLSFATEMVGAMVLSGAYSNGEDD